MRAGFSIPHLATPSVENFQRLYAGQPDFLVRSAQRAAPYFQHVLSELEHAGLPPDLALLPVIESGFDPRAISPAAAAGIWQFIPETGRRYGLRQTWLRDERRDPLPATMSAVRYLGDLYRRFGDWHLALAGYNCGEGNVARAIDRAKAAGRSTDFGGIAPFLPAETQAYVPRFLAVRNIFMQPEAYGVRLPPVDEAAQVARLSLKQDVDLQSVARAAGMSYDDLATLNAGVLREIVAASDGMVWLPLRSISRVQQLMDDTAAGPHRMLRLKAVKAAPQENLGAFAVRTRTSSAELRRINGISEALRIISSGTLFVPLASGESSARIDWTTVQPLRMQGEETENARALAASKPQPVSEMQAVWLANGWAPNRLQLRGESRKGRKPPARP